jgi:hypothetical protein
MITRRILALLLCFTLALPLIAKGGEADAKSAELVAKTEAAMGGRQAYDAIRYVSWNFFGRRLHLWDKHENRYRVQTIEEDMLVSMDLDTKEGTVYKDGKKIEDPEELKKFLNDAYEIWINDSYWLVMPWKLQDPGVHLKYKGEGSTEDGRPAHILTMTFQEVGVTPENKYEIFIDKENHLVTQWAFFPTAADEEPRFTLPWGNYQDFNGVKFSDNRGKYSMGPVAIYETIEDSIFESSDPATLRTLMGVEAMPPAEE